MATYDDPKAEHQTLTGTTADTVLLTQFWDNIEVSNRSGTAAITVTWGGTVAPTSLQPGSEVVEPGVAKLFPNVPFEADGVPGSTVLPCHKVWIVANGNAYSVVGVAGQEA